MVKEPVRVKVVSSFEEVEINSYSGRKLALHATGSNFEHVEPQIRQLIQHGYSVVYTCEQVSYSWHRNPQLAGQEDRIRISTKEADDLEVVIPGGILGVKDASGTEDPLRIITPPTEEEFEEIEEKALRAKLKLGRNDETLYMFDLKKIKE